MATAEIITIGDEILIGQIVDTNSAYIAGKLNGAGIRVAQMRSVGDNRAAIIAALQQGIARADVLVVTGGLGPTSDDITKQVLAEFTGAGGWTLHEPSMEIIRQIVTARGLPMNEQNRLQALVPDTCEVIPNPLGTAPGMWFDCRGKIIVSLPGVPFEMHALMDGILPKLQAAFSLPPVFHRTIATCGLPESALAERIAGWEQSLPPYMKLAYLPNPLTGVRLRLSVYQPDEDTEAEAARAVQALRALLGTAIYGEGDDTLETVAGRLLLERRATVATAESCTGGKIASLLTSVAGSSAWFKGGAVAYDNAVKTNVLGVAAAAIERHGAVSRQVAEQMAQGVRRLLRTDYAIATSGIAGPGGGTPEKPAGTLCIAVATPRGTHSERHQFTNDRLRNIERFSATALNRLRLKIFSVES
ncbi:MAG: CinA family nicotinamide mononucleotide deamidase-related protein [Prevotellaceae bacterium]|jgi:nicotinamide-nucleotide amidase|nr:CinA family nicotinamide mononucleotide deamidase-related protein [Prevotellaceae bacterium]